MIEIREITKRFGDTVAVDDLSFDVHPGRVTGFLGPNGSGKSTTMRCMLELDRLERGTTRFDGKQYHELDRPLFEIGALLDAGYVHPARSGRNHLRWMAASNGIAPVTRRRPCSRLVGMTEVARRKVRGYSLGMRQRLGLAGVLLGDPHTLILDEPANGLDPEGVRWIRDVLVAPRPRRAHDPRQQPPARRDLVDGRRPRRHRPRPADRAGPGEPVHRPLRPAVGAGAHAGPGGVRRRSSGAPEVAAAPFGHDGIDVQGLAIERIGELALQTQTVLHELSPQSESLEEAFLQATAGAQEYQSVDVGARLPPPASHAMRPRRGRSWPLRRGGR